MNETETSYEINGVLDTEDISTTYYVRKKGRSHVEKGTVCQDYCLADKIDLETQVVCVADGHGGEEYVKSDRGSRIACEVFCDIVKKVKESFKDSADGESWLNQLMKKEFKEEYIRSWKKAVLNDYLSEQEDRSETQGSIIKKYGTTFLFVVCTKDQIAAGQLGDGAILLFNDYNQGQLFKRHEAKVTSRTSSLASNRAEYAFIIDVYERSQFSYALISTDGIYDKLDNNDSFLLYGNSLVGQITNENAIDKPFCVEGIDVSEISKDDCTIALMLFKNKAKKYELPDMAESGYTDIKFKRSLRGIEIYEAQKEGKRYELHAVESGVNEEDLCLASCKLEKANQRIPVDDGRVVYSYFIPDGWRRMSQLIESGMHLEKKYWFHDGELSPEDKKNDPLDVHTNEYWLDVYEKLLQIKEEFELDKTVCRKYAFECAFIDEEKEIRFLLDSLYKSKNEDKGARGAFDNLLGYFSIIGKLTCGRTAVPLFGCESQGQSIVMLHAPSERKPLCRVIFNKDKGIFGLWNGSGGPWNLENEKRKEIPANGVLRLNKNYDFLVQSDEKEKIQEAEFVDNYARYQVKIFKELDQ